MTNPKVSIVTLNWNRKTDLKELLFSLQKQTFKDSEVIVIDNGSTDGSAGMVEAEFPYAKLIKLEKNVGIGAYNRGFKTAKGDFIIIIDSDGILGADGIEQIAKKLDEYPKLGVVACKIINYYVKKPAWDNVVHLPEGNDKEGYDCLSFNGCAVGIRKEAIAKVGGFSEYFFLYYNEYDLSIRILNCGYGAKYFPEIMAEHKAREPYVKSNMRLYYEARNMFFISIKYNNWRKMPISCARYLKAFMRLTSSSKDIISMFGRFFDDIALVVLSFVKRISIRKEVWEKISEIESRGVSE